MRHYMSLKARKELLYSLQRLYSESTKQQKNKLLSCFVEATGYERKYALKLLGRERHPVSRRKKGRVIYDDDVRLALIEIWKASNFLCSKRLVPFLPELVTVLEQRGHISIEESTKAKLLSISPATADRLLKYERKREERREYYGGKVVNPLKEKIPIRTFADWDDVVPGFFQIDLVAHNGGDPNGQFCHTLVMTDISTGWTDFDSIVNKEEGTVLEALHNLCAWLPINMRGIDCDNGSEFINYSLEKYCQSNRIKLTRGRPHVSNDQAHVEQKNGCIVRQTVGYDRYIGEAPRKILSELYAALRLFINFFQPSQKLEGKRRLGSKVRRRYSTALTPYQRVLAHGLPEPIRERLKGEYEACDPIALLRTIENCKVRLKEFANPRLAAVPGEKSSQRIRTKRQRRTDPLLLPNPKRPGSRRNRKHGSMACDLQKKVSELLADNPALPLKTIISMINKQYPGTITSSRGDSVQVGRLLRAWRDAHPEHMSSYPRLYGRNRKTSKSFSNFHTTC